jgi:hypothetical protein
MSAKGEIRPPSGVRPSRPPTPRDLAFRRTLDTIRRIRVKAIYDRCGSIRTRSMLRAIEAPDRPNRITSVRRDELARVVKEWIGDLQQCHDDLTAAD